ncbi:Xylem serine proteinase 1 [Platanthera guangdongensis]|uniref:Xylem serine proteinase 1 n=1 Tax=Platanthera guangdongensis TaxID=2320717 RepID=A0ABR2LGX7_9ASPA
MAFSPLPRPLLFFLLVSASVAASIPERKKHIVYLGDKPHPDSDTVGHHHRLLSDVLGSHDAAKESIFHSYILSMNAFAANLTDEEAEKVAEMDDVISVFPAHTRKLHTSRSWDFIGFPANATHSQTESNVIVGILDSGIDPYAESFTDKGFGPPPAKWRGKCASSEEFQCNNKLIGARVFRLDRKPPDNDFAQPQDYRGHGTHVASTAVGNSVPGASLFGMGEGTIRGCAPSARIASYKVCYADGNCNDEDILAGFDAAIADGVDVINLSVGEDPGKSFTDALAVGAYHAMRRDILTVASAGNEGPMHRSVVNYSPWMLTVGASTTDRQFGADLVLGNGKRITGVSVNTFDTERKFRKLVRGFDAAFTGLTYSAQMCGNQALDPIKVEDAIVLCKITGSANTIDSVVMAANGSGLVVQMTSPADRAETFNIPATVLSKEDGQIVNDYIDSLGFGGNPVAKIEKSHAFTSKGLLIPSFSARGPNPLYTEILKPDLVAPGMNILAAYPSYAYFTQDPTDKRRSEYQIFSGTSMAAPHATGAAAYIKAFHPTWSPASLRSALMTTARPIPPIPTNSTPRIRNELEYAAGSGQIDPIAAVDPGLVYDINEEAYLRFLCTKHPNTTAVAILTGVRSFDCAPLATAKGYDGLNYPSFHYIVPDALKPSAAEYRRIVTNVGEGSSVYTARVEAPAGVEIEVKPARLEFTKKNEKMVFEVAVRVAPVRGRPPYAVSGSLMWTDGVHKVRSPIVIHYLA